MNTTIKLENIYWDALNREKNKYLNEVANNPNASTLPSLKKIVTYGVKAVVLKYRGTRGNEYIDRELAKSNFNLAASIVDIMGFLTPKQFMQLFPIEKDFKGHKYGAKDYFYTRDYMINLELDKPINKQMKPIELTNEYMNWDIFNFGIAIIDAIDTIRKFDGKESIIAEFFHENGVNTHTLYTDEKGKKFLLDDETGKSVPVKTRPSYLKVKMGGKK